MVKHTKLKLDLSNKNNKIISLSILLQLTLGNILHIVRDQHHYKNKEENDEKLREILYVQLLILHNS